MSHQIANYWAPVAAIVPVFALVLVLEARRLAAAWTFDAPIPRRVQSAAVLAVATALFFVETIAVWSMAHAEANASLIEPTMWVLVLAIGILAISPVSAVFVAGNADLVFILSKMLPGSKTRRAIGSLGQLERLTNEHLADAERAKAKSQAHLSEMKALRKGMKKALAISTEFVAAATKDTSTEDLAENQEFLDMTPALHVIANNNVKQGKQLVSDATATVRDAKSRVDQISTWRHHISVGRLDEHEIDKVRAMVEFYGPQAKSSRRVT